MVAATRDSTLQPQLPQTSSVEDESLKRNTDCVYFLASPLTCKKGSECEYRHSEYARMNPMDCYFWLNGNCLNPKCSFRHPPLDGLLSTQGATSTGPSQTVGATTAPYSRGNQVSPLNAAYFPGNQVSTTNGAYIPGKQTKPCIFFQQGVCSKGDRCAFSHGLNPVINKTPQAPLATPVTEPATVTKAFNGLAKCSNVQKPLQANVSKMIEVPSIVKSAAKQESFLLNNKTLFGKSVLAPTHYNASIHIEPNMYPTTNGNNNMIWSNDMPQTDVSDDHSLQNGKDDEFNKESSPGFDVLVDDDLRDSDYYRGDDQFGRRGNEGMNLNEFDVNGSADYNNILADMDHETFRESRGYDREPRRVSSERRSLGPDHLRRSYRNSKSPDHVEVDDLRHRLSKQRRVNGLKSIINHDYDRDNCDEERVYTSSRKGSHYLPPHERSLKSRLEGRIKIPERSSSDLRSEKDFDRGRNFNSRGRLQGLQDRITGRAHEDFEERNIRRDMRTDFSGPKRLSELKVVKNSENMERKIEGQRKRRNIDDDVSFEGPKPLSEILKRKRRAEPLSGNDEEIYQKECSVKTESNDESFEKAPVVTKLEAEEGMDDAYEEKDEEFDYEYVEEGENADLEEEYVDEGEDDDDFDKKIGVMFS